MNEIWKSRGHSTLEVAPQLDPIPVEADQYFPGPYSQGLHVRVSHPYPELAYYGESMFHVDRVVGLPDQKKLTRRPWFWIVLGLVVAVVMGGIVGGMVLGLKKNRHPNPNSSLAKYVLIPIPI
jgi:hypothetical protein